MINTLQKYLTIGIPSTRINWFGKMLSKSVRFTGLVLYYFDQECEIMFDYFDQN
jgi:hypothetical protein